MSLHLSNATNNAHPSFSTVNCTVSNLRLRLKQEHGKPRGSTTLQHRKIWAVIENEQCGTVCSDSNAQVDNTLEGERILYYAQ